MNCEFFGEPAKIKKQYLKCVHTELLCSAEIAVILNSISIQSTHINCDAKPTIIRLNVIGL